MKNLIIFIIGGLGYGALELLWRGYTHISMVITGGICLLGIRLICNYFKNLSLFNKALLSAFLITAIEAVVGFIVNVKLCLNVWDYSKLPFNMCGQICLLFSFFWFLLSFILILFIEFLSKKEV